MDRRYGSTNGGGGGNGSSSQLMRPSVITNNGGGGGGGSFIPTASSSTGASSMSTFYSSHNHNHSQQQHQQSQPQPHNHSSSSSSSKLAQQLALQSQLQAQAHHHAQQQPQHNQHNHVVHHQHQQQNHQMVNNNNAHVPPPQNHYYQNLPTPINRLPQSQQLANNRSHAHVSNNYNQVGPQYGNTTINPNVHANSNGGTGFYGTLSQGKLPPPSSGPTSFNSSNNGSGNNNSNGNNVNSHPMIPSIQPVIQQIQQQHLSTQISQQLQAPEVLSEGGLPSTLVESMRTLFDILDDMKQGKVRLSDIESRWENHSAAVHGQSQGQAGENGPINGLKGNTGAEPLIKMGVLEYLRKVTPPDGMLTFERFCAGLKLALLTNTGTHTNTNTDGGGSGSGNNAGQYNPYGVTVAGGGNSMSMPIDHGSNYGQHHQQQQQQQQRPNHLPLYRGGQHVPTPILQMHHQQQLQQQQAPPPAHPPQQMPNHVNKTIVMQNGPIIPQNGNGNGSTMHRVSKIPGMPSRLPTVASSSGIPTSPTNRLNNSGSGSVLYQNQSGAPKRNGFLPQHQHQHQQQQLQMQMQNTTVALVHQPPAPNPKPQSNHSKIKSTIEALVGHSTGGSHHHYNNFPTSKAKHNYTTKNGSLDNLTSDDPISMGNMNTANKKDRPPSAPLLDLDDNRGGNHGGHNTSGISRIATAAGLRNQSVEFYSATNPPRTQIHIQPNMTNNNAGTSKSATNLRQPSQKSTLGSSKKKGSQDSGGNANSSSLSIGKRVVNFVTPRQRTLSMPQLQFNKLKATKSINLEEQQQQQQTSPSTSSATTTTEETPTASHNHVTPTGSGIPTKSASTSKIGYKSQLVPPSFILSSLKHPSKSVDPNGASTMTSEQSSSTLAHTPTGAAAGAGLFPPPPPKPPRHANNNLVLSVPNSEPLLNGNSTCGSSTGSGTPTKPEIRNVLQSWQKGVIAIGGTTIEKKPVTQSNSVGVISTNAPAPVLLNSTNNSAGAGAAGSEEVSSANASPAAAGGTDPVKLRGDKKGNQRRRETPRRHTVQSGIDFTTLKRLKQLEQERDVLQQGVSYIETAKDWYGKQLELVDDKISQLTKGAATSDHWNESHEERLNLLGCRISEVNSLLTALMDGSTSLPLHMNLQIPTHLNLKTITRLKDQNRQLTQEVSDCSHRVTQLETEKAMLLRQLFHQKTNIHNSDETVYM